MRVLVTGGSGFIGSHVVDRLQAAGHEPKIFDLVVSPYHRPAEVELVLGDVLDHSVLRDAMRGCDAVVHLAAVSDVNEVVAEPARAELVNASGTESLLEAARLESIERVVYASTIWVYGGLADDTPVDEDRALEAPTHLYTATKLAGEMYCRTYDELYGLAYTILRFGIPYGPRTRDATVVASFVNRAEAHKPLTITGSGEQSRQFVYVEDLAEGVVAALTPVGARRTYNLVGSERLSIRAIAEIVKEVVADVPIVHVPERPADLRSVEVSGERAALELGWRAVTPFRAGLRSYLEWVSEMKGRRSVPAASITSGSAATLLRHEPGEL
jgi:UDP-glucose 4-epimerase